MAELEVWVALLLNAILSAAGLIGLWSTRRDTQKKLGVFRKMTKEVGRMAAAVERVAKAERQESEQQTSETLPPSPATPATQRPPTLAERKQALAERKQAWKELEAAAKAWRYFTKK